MTQTHETNFKPNRLQRGFIESQATADLFSSRVGEGKSTGLAWSIFYHTRHNPGASWAVVRDTWENIQRSTLKTFFEWFPPGIYGTWHHTNKVFTWAEGVGKGTVTFVGMDDANDASKLLSWELAGIAMDEPAPAVGSAGIDEMVFDLGMTRLRQPGMKWYAMKLATNNPDENHWVYRKFVSPGMDGFQLWQPSTPENVQNLPENYYENMRRTLAHRPDLVRRFVDGEFGFQQEGKQVTPQWSDKIHLATGLSPIANREVFILWDFGHNPTAILTQINPMGYWNILDSFVGDGIGVTELVENAVKPLIASRYMRNPLRHIGDPAGAVGEQTSILRTPVAEIKKQLGGTWRSGPQRWEDRLNPLQSILTRTMDGRGVMQVDRFRAKEVWQALRGGYHYHVSRTNLISAIPEKNIHSHPGDAMGYGAAILFPVGRLDKRMQNLKPRTVGSYFGSGGGEHFQIGPDRGSMPTPLPKHGAILKG